MTPTQAAEENLAVGALLKYSDRRPRGDERMDPEPDLDLDDEDVFGMLLAAEHGVDPTRVSAYRSLARSRGLTLEQVLRAAFRGELREVVRLPAARSA